MYLGPGVRGRLLLRAWPEGPVGPIYPLRAEGPGRVEWLKLVFWSWSSEGCLSEVGLLKVVCLCSGCLRSNSCYRAYGSPGPTGPDTRVDLRFSMSFSHRFFEGFFFIFTSFLDHFLKVFSYLFHLFFELFFGVEFLNIFLIFWIFCFRANPRRHAFYCSPLVYKRFRHFRKS